MLLNLQALGYVIGKNNYFKRQGQFRDPGLGVAI